MHRDMRHSGGVGDRDRFYSHGMDSMSSLSSFGEERERDRGYQDRFRDRIEPGRPRVEEKLDFKRDLKKHDSWDRGLDRVGRDRNMDRGRDLERREDRGRDRGGRELNNREQRERGREISREQTGRSREHLERSRERRDNERERRDRSKDRQVSSRGPEDAKRRHKDEGDVIKVPSNSFRSGYEKTSTPRKDPDDRLERLEKMVKKLVRGGGDNIVGGESKPGEFNPRNMSFPTSVWLNQINEECLQRNFDDRDCINYIQSKMSGIIKAWFKTLGMYDYTWLELKMLITRTFPDNVDFAQTLHLLVDRVKVPDETITQYYFSKMYLLEACKISGVNAVSCLIDGLDNPFWQAEARSSNFMTPEILYSQFLCNLPNHGMQVPMPVLSSPAQRISYERERDYREPKEHRKERDNIEPTNHNSRKCYTCGKAGHMAAECRHAPICYNCNNKGHIAIKCPRK
ncbi:unnamed protein product [Acanthoscelides obtectus]|uniref:CCHC-type domain-containing protein n=1 Tax=Acanthoscelides obtectus TaxID=200917 RepID=A0A9P0LCR1_ACAOB|nr:unnamed protein product [Acanthoscelides obtectus]CAK1632902.1 Zinc finger protein GIS2 [Acanthoscelides obtectus]